MSPSLGGGATEERVRTRGSASPACCIYDQYDAQPPPVYDLPQIICLSVVSGCKLTNEQSNNAQIKPKPRRHFFGLMGSFRGNQLGAATPAPLAVEFPKEPVKFMCYNTTRKVFTRGEQHFTQNTTITAIFSSATMCMCTSMSASAMYLDALRGFSLQRR